MTGIGDLRNLGPRSIQMLATLGIHTLEDLQQWDPVRIWHALKISGQKVSLVFVYALQGAKLDVHWNALPPGLKEELKARCQFVEAGKSDPIDSHFQS